MIISHEHQFIFLKSRKTAGTSLEVALSSYCGPMDIITELNFTEETERAKLSSAKPQLYLLTQLDADKMRQAKPEKFLARSYDTLRLEKRLSQHMDAAEIKTEVGDKCWNRYFKFSIARNPWDRMVSLFYWRVSSGQTQAKSLGSYLLLEDRIDNWPFYAIDGEFVADHIIRFENLTEELTVLGERFGIDINANMPHLKGKTGRPKKHYREHYNDELRKYVAKRFEQEIDTFGYSF